MMGRHGSLREQPNVSLLLTGATSVVVDRLEKSSSSQLSVGY
jgi:hypothetical protein